jgi:hypothetical protein
MSQTWQERHYGGKRGKRDVNVARETSMSQERRQRGKTDVIRQYDFFYFKFPLFCDNMDNFVHNTANKTSEVLQYVLVCTIVTQSNNNTAGSRLKYIIMLPQIWFP